MTRKSAKHIGGLCNGLNNELNRKSRWLIKKINRKLWQNHYMQIHDSYYDITGVYLKFRQWELVRLPYTPPFFIFVNPVTAADHVSEAAMVERSKLKIILHCHNNEESDNECFMVYIPFECYEPLHIEV